MKLFSRRSNRIITALLISLLFLAQGLLCPVASSATELGTPFADVKSDHWALKYIVNLASRGIMSGDGYGNFRPDQPITQLEAVLLAVRSMGQSQAISAMNGSAPLPYTVPDWANKGVVKQELLYSIEKGLLVPSQKDFTATASADRAWISQLMVRLIGKQSEVSALSGSNPDFTDADKIPSWSIGYVNTALKYKLISKFPDGSFKPDQLVTRAQTATLLTRAEPYLSSSINQVQGPLTALSQTTIGLQVGEAIMGYTITNDSYLFDGTDRRCSWTALKLGDYVKMVVDGSNIKYLAVSERPPVVLNPQPQPQPVLEPTGPETIKKTGLVYLVSAKKRLLVLATGGQPLAYLVSTSADIDVPNINNATLSDIGDDDYVSLTISNGIITAIRVQ